jgi:hypothetical protein
MILSAGALLMVPLALSGAGRIDARGLHISRVIDGSGGILLSNVVEQAGPLLTGWVVATPIALLVWFLSVGKPWADAGRSWMAFSASMQAAAIFLVALACGPANYNVGLLVLFAAYLPAALSVPWALVGWVRHAWYALRRRPADPVLD